MNANNTYEGWCNRETWAVCLHMNSNPGDWQHWFDRANDIVREHDTRLDAALAFADEVKDSHEELYQAVIEGQRDPVRYLLGDLNPFNNVDWREIAYHWIDDAITNAESM